MIGARVKMAVVAKQAYNDSREPSEATFSCGRSEPGNYARNRHSVLVGGAQCPPRVRVLWVHDESN
jgi:hypothetical protein